MNEVAPDFQLSVPARAENVSVIRHGVRHYAETLGVGEIRLGDILLAVTEAATNCVVHAYRETSGLIDVEALCRDGSLVVRVRDHGSGVVPRIDSPGLGLGLPVMMALARTMEIHPADGGGTEVVLTFELGDEPAGP